MIEIGSVSLRSARGVPLQSDNFFKFLVGQLDFMALHAKKITNRLQNMPDRNGTAIKIFIELRAIDIQASADFGD